MNFGYSKSALSCILSQNLHSHHKIYFFLHLGYLVYAPINAILGERGRVGILIASVVLGCILTQNCCPWCIKYSKCMVFLVNFDKTCPGDKPLLFPVFCPVGFFCLTFRACIFFRGYSCYMIFFFTVKALQEFLFSKLPPPPPTLKSQMFHSLGIRFPWSETLHKLQLSRISIWG